MLNRPIPTLLALVLASALAGCADDPQPAAETGAAGTAEAFPSTYAPPASATLVFRNATILTGSGEQIERGTVLVEDGRIAAIGTDIEIPSGAEVLDLDGKWLTPGLIDNHSHLGVYPSPRVRAHSDGNEATDPNTAEVWAEHSVWPQDPGFVRALEGGVTTLALLPGSANLFGGRIVTMRNLPGARTVQDMKFPGAPHGLKMACGENPKRVYGRGRNRSPATRMGNVAGYRAAWIEAAEYKRKRDAYREKLDNGEDAGDPPKRDLELETLAGVLDGDIRVHNHCYRADEMAIMIDIAKEFDYEITSFHHAVEAYKIADLLAEEGVCSSMWADWWGFKIEAWDGIRENIAMVEAAGACAIVHSDSAVGIQRLNQEAAKALAAGRRVGLELDAATAIQWITLNPAESLGVGDEVGSLEPGKRADLVVWDMNPFSVYARTERVYLDGARVWDRHDPEYQPRTDFELGNFIGGGAR